MLVGEKIEKGGAYLSYDKLRIFLKKKSILHHLFTVNNCKPHEKSRAQTDNSFAGRSEGKKK